MSEKLEKMRNELLKKLEATNEVLAKLEAKLEKLRPKYAKISKELAELHAEIDKRKKLRDNYDFAIKRVEEYLRIKP